MIELIFFILNLIVFLFFFKFKEVFCYKLKLINYPSNKTFHKEKSYIYGGIILIPSYIINFIYNQITLDQNIYINLILLISFFILTLLDDIYNLNALTKTLFSVLILAINIFFDRSLNIYYLNSIFFGEFLFLNNHLIAFIFPIFSIILFINAFNFTDGINGLASLIGISILAYLVIKNNFVFNNIFLIIFFIFFFFYLNLKYSIFLGDSGNYLISILISYILIKENFINPGLYSCEEIFMLLLIPGIDMLRLFFDRIYKKKNPFKKDNNHLHHILFYRFGLTKALIIYLMLINTPIYLNYFYKDMYINILLTTLVFYIFLTKKKILK